MADIYIPDRGHHQIIKIPDLSGKPASRFGSKGSAAKQFNQPAGLFIDQAHRIYVADLDNHRIARMDDLSGKNWTSLGTHGSGVKQFNRPAGVCLDGNNRIYVADTENHRIVRMDDLSGKNWTAFGSKGNVQGNDSAKLEVLSPERPMCRRRAAHLRRRHGEQPHRPCGQSDGQELDRLRQCRLRGPAIHGADQGRRRSGHAHLRGGLRQSAHRPPRRHGRQRMVSDRARRFFEHPVPRPHRPLRADRGRPRSPT